MSSFTAPNASAVLSRSRGLLGAFGDRVESHKTTELQDHIHVGGMGAISFRESYPLLSLLTYLLFLAVPLVLFTLRELDDNRLVSWYWSISANQSLLMFAVLAIVLLSAVPLSRIAVSDRYSIAVLMLVSFVMSIPLWAAPESIIDNGRYFGQAKSLELFGLGYFLQHWGESIFAWTDLPLIPMLYGFAFNFFGEHRLVIQIVTSLFFTGTVLLTYLIGTALWNSSLGIIAAVLLLGMPYLYSQIPLMMIDIPAMFFLSLAVYATIIAVRLGGKLAISLASVSILFAVMSKYSIWLLLSVIPLTVLAQHNESWGKVTQRVLLVLSGALFLFALVFIWQHEIMIEQIRVLLSYQWGALGRWQESAVSTFFFQIHPVVSIAAIIAVGLAIKNRDKKMLIAGWMLALVFFMGINRIRYLLVLFPMLALVSAYAIAAIPSVEQRKFVAYGVAISSYVIALVVNLGFLQNTSANNLMMAGKYLDSIDVQAVNIVVLPQQRSVVNPQIAIPTLDYHTSKPIVYMQSRVFPQATDKVGISKSPVRFTWEYPVPEYYRKSFLVEGQPMALAVIYSDINQQIPASIQYGYRLIKQFRASTEVFKYKTLVDIYLPV